MKRIKHDLLLINVQVMNFFLVFYFNLFREQRCTSKGLFIIPKLFTRLCPPKNFFFLRWLFLENYFVSIPFITFNIKQNVSKMFNIKLLNVTAKLFNCLKPGKFKDTKNKDHTLNKQFPCLIPSSKIIKILKNITIVICK